MNLILATKRPKIGDKKANLAFVQQTIENNPGDFYIFGELFLTGYHCKDNHRSYAETIQGPSIQHLTKLAQQHNCYIVIGMPLKTGSVKGLIYNSAVLLHPDGHVDSYNKWFLPTTGPFEEKLYFNEGEDIPVFKTQYGTVGILICYDIYFPELSRALTLQGADMLICISASPTATRYYFETLIPARAVENTSFFAYVNLVGTQENMVFWGGSQLYDPLGKLIIKAPYFKDSIIQTDINLADVENARGGRPILRDIRSSVYHDLYDLSRGRSIKKK